MEVEDYRAFLMARLVEQERDRLAGRVLDAGRPGLRYRRLAPDSEWVGLDEDVGATLPFGEAEFDAVLSVDMLQQVEEPSAAVREMYRVLKPGGQLVLLAPSFDRPDPESLWRFHAPGVRFLLTAAGFETETLEALNSPAGGTVTAELTQFKTSPRYEMVLPDEVQGWLDHMDESYPMMIYAAARKPA
jgi:SAM-dependent methyltransferase